MAVGGPAREQWQQGGTQRGTKSSACIDNTITLLQYDLSCSITSVLRYMCTMVPWYHTSGTYQCTEYGTRTMVWYVHVYGSESVGGCCPAFAPSLSWLPCIFPKQTCTCVPYVLEYHGMILLCHNVPVHVYSSTYHGTMVWYSYAMVHLSYSVVWHTKRYHWYHWYTCARVCTLVL